MMIQKFRFRVHSVAVVLLQYMQYTPRLFSNQNGSMLRRKPNHKRAPVGLYVKFIHVLSRC